MAAIAKKQRPRRGSSNPQYHRSSSHHDLGMHHDLMSQQFVDSAACGDLDGVKELLLDPQLTSDSINAVDKDGRSAFHYSCLNDDIPLLRTLIADARVDVNLCSPRGETALHMASLYAALEALSVLFEDGRCSLNAQNKFGETPLHLCAGSGDKGAAKTAKLLLDNGASLTVTDKWGRGPKDVSHANAENQLVGVFTAFLDARPELKAEVEKVSKAHRAESEKPVYTDAANHAAKTAIFGMLGGVKLKKTTVVEKTMFGKSEGAVSAKKAGGGKDAAATGDGRKALSKLVDFPGDKEEIRKHLENAEGINPGGADAYGLTALHKFASWNKTELLEMLIPKLSKEQLQAKCPEGKTALHWSVEMASVGAIKLLVKAGVDTEAKDAKGRSVAEILDHVEQSGVIERLKKALAVSE